MVLKGMLEQLSQHKLDKLRDIYVTNYSDCREKCPSELTLSVSGNVPSSRNIW